MTAGVNNFNDFSRDATDQISCT